MIEVTCPRCGRRSRAPDEALGRTARCSACGEGFRVEGAPAPIEEELVVLQPVESGPTCPGCRRTFDRDVLVCTRCGIDLATGRRIVREASSDDEVVPSEEPIPWYALPIAAFPGLLVVRTLVLSIVLFALAVGAFGAFFFFLALGILFTAVAAGAIALILYGQALGWMMTGETSMLHEILTDFNGTQWTIWLACLLAPAVAGFGLIGVVRSAMS